MNANDIVISPNIVFFAGMLVMAAIFFAGFTGFGVFVGLKVWNYLKSFNGLSAKRNRGAVDFQASIREVPPILFRDQDQLPKLNGASEQAKTEEIKYEGQA